jgi:hypothetical protein
MADSEITEPREAGPEELLRGPHAWLNWRAQRDGAPVRETSRTSSPQVLPTWTEFALYSDARFTGSPELGPYQLLVTLPQGPDRPGEGDLQVILRCHDHLPDPDLSAIDFEKSDRTDFHGGDQADEIAALVGLAVGRRLRSGGPTRRMYAGSDPAGSPIELDHHPPTLTPPRRAPMLPGIAEGAQLDAAAPLLSSYPDLQADDAVALVRAASQYADALWLADADPRLAWIKLVGALETAANRWETGFHDSPLARLEQHRPVVFNAIAELPTPAQEVIAKDLAHTFKATAKFVAFTLEFDPGPPARRPSTTALDWSSLDEQLNSIYDLRSRDLHDGLPFPPPLCEPPSFDPADVPHETFPHHALMTLGGVWRAEDLPMLFHVFGHIAGGALRNWWSELAGRSSRGEDAPNA